MAYNSRGGQRQEPTADYDIQPDVPMQTCKFLLGLVRCT